MLRSVLILDVSSMSSFCINAPATTEIYTLSLHDALPIYTSPLRHAGYDSADFFAVHEDYGALEDLESLVATARSEEHTSELQSLRHLVCRLLLEKKKEKVKQSHP